ncbi:MAG: DUF4383 domain-containing protein [Planctomycetota bacterium]|nr:DUF4383 domain-containing protein [Planctomycetota bacterium]
MKRSPARLYTALAGVFLLLQGASTLAFRLVPSLDEAFPHLLGVTHMMPAHSILHIVSGLLALALLRWGGERGVQIFAAGFGAFYVALAVYGWLAKDPTVLHLQPFDHPFHLVLGLVGLVAVRMSLPRSRRDSRARA